jgi:putative tryptophan/tyrosine transport system substrate-binding protein
MRRRDFIALLSSAAAAWPLAAAAQQQLLPVIGYLSDGSPSYSRYRDILRIFQKGLAEGGFEEGRNVAIEYRWAESDYGRLPGLAADLVQRHVAVLVSTGATSTSLAAMAATKVIPIVFATGGDPVQLGLVASLSRPGGNLTGATNLNTELLPKRLELLHDLVPAATRMALLVNPNSPGSAVSRAQAAARSLGLQLDVVRASAQPDFAAAFETAARSGAGGLVIAGDGLFVARAAELAELALRHRLPAIFQFPQFTAAGGLMSYSTSLSDHYRFAGLYTARILKGEKPSDLPVYQTTKIELIVNMKTAKALGITVPSSLLALADEVIE